MYLITDFWALNLPINDFRAYTLMITDVWVFFFYWLPIFGLVFFSDYRFLGLNFADFRGTSSSLRPSFMVIFAALDLNIKLIEIMIMMVR